MRVRAVPLVLSGLVALIAPHVPWLWPQVSVWTLAVVLGVCSVCWLRRSGNGQGRVWTDLCVGGRVWLSWEN
jgi:Flp pilus assembly protein TadB